VSSVSARGHTRLLAATTAGIEEAAAILRAGGLVAFPTETVYGLGADALNPEAIRRIFEAKGRPADDPLIVHVAQADQIETIGVPNSFAAALGDHFWPGPLTLVIEKLPLVPHEVTAGLDTVAVRVPSHPLARALLEASGRPLAAPSANLFGRPSPTRAEHVLDDLNGRIDALIDGGPTTVGVESTIVDVATAHPRLLRAGGLAAEEIEAVLGIRLLPPPAPSHGPQLAPGSMPVHYSPRTPLLLVTGPPDLARVRLLEELDRAIASGHRVGVLALEEDLPSLAAAARIEVVGAWSDPRTSASRLFDAVRALDASSLDVLLSRELADPSVGLGRALADRLRRASRRVIDTRH
jgi:L-threonylcarbamoyladenylate synthase